MIEELVRKNRSYRGYDRSVRLGKQTLKELIDLARLCPSSVNLQPLAYLPVSEEDGVRAVQQTTAWAKALPELTLPHPGKEPTDFIVICQDTDIDSRPARFQKDIGIVAQTMLLGAVEKGYGGCMIGNFNKKALIEALGLPAHYDPQLVVAFGKPDETVVITDTKNGTGYYRDADDVHYVPKRALEEIIICVDKQK